MNKKRIEKTRNAALAVFLSTIVERLKHSQLRLIKDKFTCVTSRFPLQTVREPDWLVGLSYQASVIFLGVQMPELKDEACLYPKGSMISSLFQKASV